MSGVRSFTRRPAILGPATTTSAPVYVDSDDNIVKINPLGSGTEEKELAYGGAERVITTNVITASEQGKTFFLALAGGFQTTLPLISGVAVGARFKFICAISPTTAYTIITNASDVNNMIGSVNECETDTTEDGPSTTGADLFSFVANVALIGDWVEFVSDGTNWLFTGQTVADGAVTIA